MFADDLDEENTIEVLVEERTECEVKMEADTKAKSDNNVKKVVHETTKIIRFLNCTFCDVKTDKKSGLQKHEDRKTRKISYIGDECEVCCSVFETDEYLRKHVKNVHLTARFLCSFGDKKLTYKATKRKRCLKIRRQFVLYLIKYCNDCEYRTNKMSHLKRHQVFVHK